MGKEEEGEDPWWLRFYARILDFLRISVAVSEPSDVLRVVELLRAKMDVKGLKNGFRQDAFVPPSGYRDVKLLVMFGPEGEQMIVEIQVVLEKWLVNKKETSVLY